jgi:hypothetical protein
MRIKMMKHEPTPSSATAGSIFLGGCIHERTCRILRIIVVIVVCTFILVAQPALAQTSAIVGTVADPSGASLPGASVQAVNADNGVTRMTNSSGSGTFALPELPIGTYTLTVSHAGFGSAKIAEVRVDINQAAKVSVVLKIASQVTTVTVNTQTDLLDTETSENGQVVDNHLVQSIPLNGRDFTRLTLLAAGAQSNVEGNLSGGVVIDGQRSTSNQYVIDGADTTVGGGPFAYRTPGSGTPQGAAGTSTSLATLDSIEEFKVQTSNYSAQYGTESGGIVNIVTKSGTNLLHGSVFDYIRDSRFDANDYFLKAAAIKEPPFTFNDIGGTIGGPVIRNKTFFFGTFEHLQEVYSRAVNGTTLSTEARAAALPVMQPLVNFFPLPTGTDNGDGSADYTGTSNSHGGENDFSVRLDHQIDAKDRIYGRYSFGNSNSGVGGGLGAFPLTLQTTLARIQTASAVETHTFSQNLINTLNVGYSRNAADIYAELKPGLGTSGDPFGADGQPVLPQVAILSITLRGGSSPPQISHINDFTYRDFLTWNHGAHTINMGVDVRRVQDNLNNYANAAGLFLWLVPGPFEQDQPFFFNDFIGNLHEGFRFTNIAPYVEDNWRVTHNLTLDIGLRYELNTVPTEAHGLVRNINEITSLSTALLTPFGANVYKGDYNNFAPRVGFSYSPLSHTVVRGAFGIYFDTSTQLAGELFFNPGITAENVIYGPELAPGEPAAFPINPALLQTTVSPNPPYTTSTVIDPNLRNAYTEAYSFNVEQEFGSSTVLKLGYVGNVGRKLYRERVLNLLLNGATTPPNPNFPTGGIDLLDNSAVSSYNALQTTLIERMGQRLQGTVAYTWSHSIDEVSTNGGYSSVNSDIFPTNPQNLAADRSDSDFDLRQNLTASLTYLLPLDRFKSLPKLLSNGWNVGGLLAVHSAFPYTALLGAGTVNDGDPNLAAGERPDPVAGASKYISSAQFSRVANAAAFQCPGGGAIAGGCPVNGRFGTVSRNSLRAFGFRQLDVNLSKDFTIRDSVGVEFRVEAFNLTNTANFANPGTSGTNSLTSAHFGQPTAMANYSSSGIGQYFNSGSPRNLQFAARIHF